MIIKPDRNILEAGLFIEVCEIVPHQKYWLIKTKAGNWLAKPIWDNCHAKWWKEVDKELRNRGFQAMPTMRQVDNWVLYHYIEGTMCRYQQADEAIKVVQTLASFHLAGQKLDTPPCQEATYLLSDRLYERLNKFYAYVKYPERVKNRELHSLLCTFGIKFYQHGYASYQTVIKGGLVENARKAWSLRMLTHRDLASHNWMNDSLGNLWLIDFETADYDLQVGDIWQIFSRILTEHNWDISLFDQLLTTYQQIRPLTDWERKTLIMLCSFPNEFFRELIGLIEQKAGYKQDITFSYLEKIASDYEIWVSSVKRMAASVI